MTDKPAAPGGRLRLRVLAPAKINLYLHVVGRRSDGYHLLDSLIAFADVGDRLTAEAANRLSLCIAGPEARPLAGLGDDNLVMRAARRLAAAINSDHQAPRGAKLRLEKELPVAAGLGGGSSDAAAALRLLDRLWRPRLGEARLTALGLELGADIPACLAGRAVWVAGVGERLAPADGLPAAGVVLANPRRPLPTADVFRSRTGPFSEPGRFEPMPRTVAELASILRIRRNDLTTAALTLMPEIGLVLQHLSALPGALFAGMSGSGASCFALFSEPAAAVAAGRELTATKPEWWTAAGQLNSMPPAIEAF